MKGFGGPIPLWLIFAGILAFFFDSRKRRKKSKTTSKAPHPDLWEEEKKKDERQNVEAVKRMIAAHADCTAEVFNVVALGWGRVYQFRKVRPGDPVEIRRHNGLFKVYVENRYVSDIYAGEQSLLPRIFDENIPFEAFLGGRDMQSAYRDTERDFCSIIIFYRIPGVQPTKVNLEVN